MTSSSANAVSQHGRLAELRRHDHFTTSSAAGLLTRREPATSMQRGRRFDLPPARLPALAVGTAALACVAAPLVVGMSAPPGVRLAAVLAFMCTAPGVAFVAAAGGRGEIGLIVGLSLGVVVLVAQLMLSLGYWRPEAVLDALAAACLLTLAASNFARGRIAEQSAVRRALGVLDLRLALGRLREAAGVHALLLALAVAAWGLGIAGARLSRMGGVGLLQAVSPLYFVAFALVLVGFALAVSRDEPQPKLLAAYVVTLIVIVHATTALLYDEPRYAWTYKHLGVINLIAATGHMDRQIDVYNNWPGFFAANAWLSTTTGIAPITYAGWAQLFFNLVNAAVVRFAVGSLTADKQIAWTATFFFVLGNWVGQDYLAPQAFGFVVSLVVIGLGVRHPRIDRHWREVRSHTTEQLHRLTSVRVLVSYRGPARVVVGSDAGAAISRRRPLPPLSSVAALVAGGLCFVAVVVSHQLSPLLLIAQVAALTLLVRTLPLWIPAVMIAIEAWWLVLAWPFIGLHFALLDPGGAAAAAPGRNLTEALPGAALSFYAPLAVTMSMAALAAVGTFRRGRTDRRGLVPVSLIVVPVLVVMVQSYGGEGPYRAYLFALPWLAFLAAFACAGARGKLGRRRLRPIPLVAASTLVGTCSLFAYFGQELINRIPIDDVRAATWYEQHAPAGSLRINLAPIGPDRLTARYPLVALADPSSLLEQRAFTGHRLGSADVPRLERYIDGQGRHRAYVILTIAQQDYGRLNGLLPPGSVQSLTTALERTRSFRLVYRRPTAWVFEYLPAGHGTAGGRASEAANS